MDFEVIELNSKDPSDEALDKAIIAIQLNGIALKVLWEELNIVIIFG
jgi:hypothetical protein